MEMYGVELAATPAVARTLFKLYKIPLMPVVWMEDTITMAERTCQRTDELLIT